MSKKGRKRAVPKEIVHEIFDENFDKIVKDNKVKSVQLNQAIWIEIQNDHRVNNLMTLRALYTEALKWWKSKNKTDQTPKHHDDFDISVELSGSDIDSNNSDRSDKENSEHIIFSVI